jgi:hypothetical protein
MYDDIIYKLITKLNVSIKKYQYVKLVNSVCIIICLLANNAANIAAEKGKRII